jgi:hypothetical protein
MNKAALERVPDARRRGEQPVKGSRLCAVGAIVQVRPFHMCGALDVNGGSVAGQSRADQIMNSTKHAVHM